MVYGYIIGERKSGVKRVASKAAITFFKQFDVDGDGRMSYTEFLLVLTLMSISENDVKTIFDVVDIDNSGYIDSEEFKSIIEMLQSMANVESNKPTRSSSVGAR